MLNALHGLIYVEGHETCLIYVEDTQMGLIFIEGPQGCLLKALQDLFFIEGP